MGARPVPRPWERDHDGPCKAAGDDASHQLRAVDAAGYCYTCHHARRRHRRAVSRAGSQRRNFGMATPDIEALERYQRHQNARAGLRGTCAGCGRATGVSKALATDHNHAHCAGPQGCRDCVRGRLCSVCNRLLGHFRDDPVRLIALARYLLDPPWPKVRAQLDQA